ALSLQVADVVPAVNRLEEGLLPGGGAGFAAGRAGAEDIALPVLALDGDDDDVTAEGRGGTVAAVTQVGPADPAGRPRPQRREHTFRLPLLQRVAAPPGRHQGVALDHLLEAAQQHGVARPAARQPRGDRRAEAVAAAGPGEQVDHLLG